MPKHKSETHRTDDRQVLVTQRQPDDSEGAGRRGGWQSVAARPRVGVDLFVAGGLDADCVGEAIERLRPDGVDVATGVESSVGVKDRGRMERFIAAVREADRGAR